MKKNWTRNKTSTITTSGFHNNSDHIYTAEYLKGKL